MRPPDLRNQKTPSLQQTESMRTEISTSERANTAASNNTSERAPVTIGNISQPYFRSDRTNQVKMLESDEERTPRKNKIVRKLLSGSNNTIQTHGDKITAVYWKCRTGRYKHREKK